VGRNCHKSDTKISVKFPARLRVKLHTLHRDNVSSMKKFTEYVFKVAKHLRSRGKVIGDDKVKGVVHCGADHDLYAIQLDKWLSTHDDYTSA